MGRLRADRGVACIAAPTQARHTSTLPDRSTTSMAIEVKIPTILRTYTGGAKSVEAKGDTLAASSTTWTPATPGSRAGSSPTTATCTASSTSTSTTRTSGSPVRWRPRSRTATRSRSCRPSPAADPQRWPASTRSIDALGDTPLVGLPRLSPRWDGRAPGTAVGQARGPQPDRLDQGPRRAGDGARGRGRRPADARAAPSSSRRPATPASRWRWSPSCVATGWCA